MQRIQRADGSFLTLRVIRGLLLSGFLATLPLAGFGGVILPQNLPLAVADRATSSVVVSNNFGTLTNTLTFDGDYTNLWDGTGLWQLDGTLTAGISVLAGTNWMHHGHLWLSGNVYVASGAVFTMSAIDLRANNSVSTFVKTGPGTFMDAGIYPDSGSTNYVDIQQGTYQDVTVNGHGAIYHIASGATLYEAISSGSWWSYMPTVSGTGLIKSDAALYLQNGSIFNPGDNGVGWLTMDHSFVAWKDANQVHALNINVINGASSCLVITGAYNSANNVDLTIYVNKRGTLNRQTFAIVTTTTGWSINSFKSTNLYVGGALLSTNIGSEITFDNAAKNILWTTTISPDGTVAFWR